MALFFDRDWFDARLAERAISRDVLAAVSGISPTELDDVFKDQRELSVAEVAAFAELLGVTPAEIAHHAGVSTPVPGQDAGARIVALETRVAALETELQRLTAWVRSRSS
ncbi:MAG: DNA-binding protein [Caulobacter sp.]|nr:DNA-binding protein [Caulobacter sp.]